MTVLGKAEKILAQHEADLRALESDRAEMKRLQKQSEADRGNLEITSAEISSITGEWDSARASTRLNLDIDDAETGLGLLDELSSAEDAAAALERRIRSIRS